MSVVRAHHPASELWWKVGLAALVGLASSVSAMALRGGVHSLFDALEGVRQSPFGVFLPAVGALLGVWVVRLLFREPGGHGVPAVLESVSRQGGSMRRRSMVSRMFGSLLTVSGGGSAGLEGPIVFSAGAVGSFVASLFRLADRHRILLLACGVAGGIGSIFNAPLTGFLFAMEVVLAEWSLGAVIPLAVASVVATESGRAVLGAEGAFTSAAFEWGPVDLGACAFLGAAAGVLSVILVRGIFKMESWGKSLKSGELLGRTGVVAAVAGLLVGLLALVSPEISGEGYGVVNSLLSQSMEETIPFLCLLLGAKVIATMLTLGSNAPGGVFAPSLVLGAVLGSAFGLLLAHLFPTGSFASPGFFALVAMAGLVAGTMQAPLTGIFLALETTGGWDHTVPLMLVAVLSALVSRSLMPHSFYTWELAETGRLLRPGTDNRILAELTAEELFEDDCPTVPSGVTLDSLVIHIAETQRNHFAVVHPETGAWIGMLDLASLRPFIFDETLRRATTVDTVLESGVPAIQTGDSLGAVTEQFENSGRWVLPVVDEAGRFLGTISKSTLFDRYRSELIVQTAERRE
ncbi:MAG: chloride channel protein [Planctomycetes bacterium]|nr:chloride channel protein [Planctomycetota bacterium]